ncbi:8-oxo-dGTP diphosphatase [Modicisalibacter muralis]|uniref:8-oxo-dGTP diphosphatase n=1 Tax=Modicisalibacter muralis TaxID=119000 RepID=A0A1G9EMQ2_9GAMM|nr:(deoxy)nucleoside triphosphate pyrophosphohydrolase [Halomonas muralis]SDK77410.1 8-oxo-dGTP diphosphatase [Halomonas muralis]
MKNVAAALIINGGHILLTRRAPGENLAGYWEFPGGKQELGETIQQCAQRELEEELSLPSIAGEVFMESIYRYEGGAINLVGVLVEAQRGPLTLTVHDRAEWIPISQLMQYELAPADIPIAEKLAKIYG